jgi:hypothetical protein
MNQLGSKTYMRKLLLGGLLGGASALSLLAATTPVYINNSPLLPPALPPQIDATAFVNRSTFDVSTFFGGFIFVVGDTAFALGGNLEPFEMMNTRFITNAPGAIMRGSPGFRFDYFSSAQNARIAQTAWENRGTIIADPLLRVMSTNILNRGLLETTDLGLIRLQGTNVDVSRSAILAGRSVNTAPSFGGGTAGTNHFNASGVADLDWGAGINNRVAPRTNSAMRLNVPGFTNINQIRSPPADYIQMVGNGFITNLWVNFGAGSHPFVYTNQIGPNEFQVQVVFVPTNFTSFFGVSDFTTDVRFVPGNANGGADVIIAMESRDFDIISGTEVINGLYFVDHSAFTTNITMTWNGPDFLGARRTRRPSTYELFRSRPFQWGLGVPANGVFTETTLYNTNMVTNFVVNGYAHYGASFASPALTNVNFTPGVPVFPPPGRVEIFAENLNMDRARFKAETTLTIKAKNVSSNAVAFVDAPLIDYDLGSLVPPLVITNLAPADVRRLSGVIDMWTGVWQTQERPDPTDTNNVVTTDFHVLIFEFFQLQTDVNVVIRDLFLDADQINFGQDQIITVGRSFRIDARDWTIADTSVFTLPQSYSLGASNVLNLVNFTNFGIVNASGSMNFGLDDNMPRLENYVIAPGGSFSAAGHRIGSESVQIGGSLFASAGGIVIDATSVNLSGNLSARSDIEIRAGTLSASNSFIFAGLPGAPASLIFDVTDSFTDAGIGEPNEWTAFGGIRALTLPSTGDLLGTTVRIPVAPFGEALILWPSADFGPSAGGFGNNLALRTLALDGGTFSLVRFEGVQDPGAIYIDRLELLGEFASDQINTIEIAPNMTVYFADSNIDPTVLDGLHGGRLRWVPDFAGALNSTNIVYPTGETYTFNTALIRSTTLDSDGDGIVNALDSTPVIVGDRIDLKISCSRGATRKTALSWMAPANSTSVVEYKDSLHATGWRALPPVANTGAAQRLSITDEIPAAASSQRFYRVRTEQR